MVRSEMNLNIGDGTNAWLRKFAAEAGADAAQIQNYQVEQAGQNFVAEGGIEHTVYDAKGAL